MERRDDAVEAGREAGTPSDSPADRKSWEEPKLAFIEPKLNKHGNLEKVTGDPNGFFGDFSP